MPYEKPVHTPPVKSTHLADNKKAWRSKECPLPEIYALTTELMLVNAVNYICSSRSDCKKICILIGRIASERNASLVESLGLFEKVYFIDYHEPQIKYFIRSQKTRAHFSLRDLLSFYLAKNRCEEIARSLFESCKGLDKYIGGCGKFFFHSNNHILTSIINKIPATAELHLLEEGIASYLKTTIPIDRVHAIHLYDPSLAIFRSDKNQHLFKTLPPISRRNARLLELISKLFPNAAPIKDSAIYLDQPVGKSSSSLKRAVSSHYRRLQEQYAAKIKILKELLQTNKNIVIRLHPASLNDKNSFKRLGEGIKYQISTGNTPFEFELAMSSLRRIELYSLFSTAACYWRLLFSDDMIAGKTIKVHLLYPLMHKQLSSQEDEAAGKELLEFFERLCSKYPLIFTLSKPD